MDTKDNPSQEMINSNKKRRELIGRKELYVKNIGPLKECKYLVIKNDDFLRKGQEVVSISK